MAAEGASREGFFFLTKTGGEYVSSSLDIVGDACDAWNCNGHWEETPPMLRGWHWWAIEFHKPGTSRPLDILYRTSQPFWSGQGSVFLTANPLNWFSCFLASGSLFPLVLLGHSVDTPIRLTINGKGPKGNKSLSSRISQRHDASVLYLMAWDWKQTLSRMSCFLQVWISFFLRSLKASLIFPASSTLHSFICAVVCWSWLLTCSWESIVHISTPLWVQWCHVGSLKSAKVFFF